MKVVENLKQRIAGKDVIIRGRTFKAYSVSPENQKTVFKFVAEMEANEFSPISIGHYISVLARLGEDIKKPYKDADKENISGFFAHNKAKNMGPGALHRDKKCLKRFYKWLLGDGEVYPPCVRWLHQNGKEMKRRLLPEELLTPSEVKRLIDACDNSRDRCIISLLYESGCRRGEIISVRIQDVSFKKDYCTVTFPGEVKGGAKTARAKTGSYTVPLTDSMPYLRELINSHPNKADPNSSLFISHKSGEPLEASGIYFMIKRLAKKVLPGKRTFVHLFRHSANTNALKRGLNPMEVNLLSGRKQNSRVIDRYIHLSTEHLHNRVLELKGIRKPTEQKEDKTLVPLECWQCRTRNPPGHVFCFQCGATLKQEIREKIKRQQESSQIATAETMLTPTFAEKVLKELRENPENVDKMISVFKELKDLTKK